MTIRLQKHERVALDAARSILGPEVTFTHGRKYATLGFGRATHKVSMGTDDESSARRAALSWAKRIKGQ